MHTTDLNWNQKIESTTGASEHMAFVQQTGKRFKLGDEFNQKMLTTLSVINQRLNDENLYITVVGQASTGKSTFINALLGGVLLEAHVNQMTTTISTKVVYGIELAVHVQFKEEAADTAFQTWGLGIIGGQRIGETGWKLNDSNGSISFKGEKINLRTLITKLTTSDAVAKYIDVLTIYYPSSFLKPGIVLIDTPGANATNQIHKEITRKAVAQSDTSIIITAGDQAVTGWLVEAFSDSTFLRPFVHRSVFVMTRMDVALKAMRRIKRQEAINEIYQDAFQRLVASLKNIGLSNKPQLFFCAAQSVLDSASDEEVDPYWISEFEQLKEQLFQGLIKQRAINISESVLRLIEDFLHYMEAHLLKLWEEFKTKKAQLETAVQDLDEFCNNQKKQWAKTLKSIGKTAATKAEMVVIEAQDDAIDELRQQIFDAESFDQLKSTAEDVNWYVKKYVDNVESKLKKQLNSISSEAQKFTKNFDAEFSKHYQKLNLIANNSIGGAKLNTGLSSTASLNFGLNLEGTDPGGRFVGGAVLGGLAALVLGTAFFPLAILGGLFALFSQPSLPDAKNKAWNELEPKLKSLFREIKDKASQSVDDYQDELGAAVNQHIKAYEKKYSSVVRKMRTDQELEHRNILQQQQEIESTLVELQKRRLTIKAQQEELKLR